LNKDATLFAFITYKADEKRSTYRSLCITYGGILSLHLFTVGFFTIHFKVK